MPKGAYRKGANAERELMALAKESGAEVYRGAGSHGAYDVIITTRAGVRYLVNIKCNSWAGVGERTRLGALSSEWDIPILAQRVDRKGWRFRTITRTGLMGSVIHAPPWQ